MDKRKALTLSVVMCNYNFGHFIKDALDGIVLQSVQPLELILIDDCSTDNSVEVIKPYVEQYPWITLHCNPKNIGAYKSAQYALETAKGDLIYFACSDDRLLPGFFEATLAAFEEHPQAGLSCCIPLFFEETEHWPTPEYFPISSKDYHFLSPKAVESAYKKGLWIAGHTAVYKRKAVIEAGGVNESLGHLCDWFFSQVIAYRYGLIKIERELAAKRTHQQALSCKEAGDCTKHYALIQLIESPAYKDVRKSFYRFCVFKADKGKRPYLTQALFMCGVQRWLAIRLAGYHWLSQCSLIKRIKKHLTALQSRK